MMMMMIVALESRRPLSAVSYLIDDLVRQWQTLDRYTH